MAERSPARILGLPASRLARAEVTEWAAPTEAQANAMPLPPAYPRPVWDLAGSLEAITVGAADRYRPLAPARDTGDSAVTTADRGSEEEADAAGGLAEQGSEAGPQTMGAARAAAQGPAAPALAVSAAGPSAAALARDESDLPPRELVGRHPDSAARVVRSWLLAEGDTDDEGLSGVQRAAIAFAVLGQEGAGEIMKHLTDYEIEEISKATLSLRAAAPETQRLIFEALATELRAGRWVARGGIDFTRGALERAVGPRKAQEILDRVASTTTAGFYMLKNVAPEQVAPFISHEHPQTIALILSQLDADQAAGVLAQLPQRMQADVSYRIATMENISPSVLKEIEEALEASLRDILSGNQDVGGPKVVADILNLTGSSVEKNVLDQMDGQDPEVAEAVRNLMFTFADIGKLAPPHLKLVVDSCDRRRLTIALKAAEEELKDRILGCLTEEERKVLTEEMEYLGPMRVSEVEEVQLRIVQTVRELEEGGKITIVRGDGDDAFV